VRFQAMHPGQRQVAMVDRHQGHARAPIRRGPPQEAQLTVAASDEGLWAQEQADWPSSRGKA